MLLRGDAEGVDDGDACFDRDEEIHHVLVEKIIPLQATVVTVEEFVAGQS